MPLTHLYLTLPNKSSEWKKDKGIATGKWHNQFPGHGGIAANPGTGRDHVKSQEVWEGVINALLILHIQ